MGLEECTYLPFMHLIADDVCEGAKAASTPTASTPTASTPAVSTPTAEMAQQEPSRTEEYPRPRPSPTLSPDSISHDLAHLLPALLSHTLREAHCAYTARLRDDDGRLGACTVCDRRLEQELGKLCGLARSCGALEDERVGSFKRGENLRALSRDWKRRTSADHLGGWTRERECMLLRCGAIAMEGGEERALAAAIQLGTALQLAPLH